MFRVYHSQNPLVEKDLSKKVLISVIYRCAAWGSRESCRLLADWSSAANQEAARFRAWRSFPPGHLQSQVETAWCHCCQIIQLFLGQLHLDFGSRRIDMSADVWISKF
jgi:hypothetical protein